MTSGLRLWRTYEKSCERGGPFGLWERGKNFATLAAKVDMSQHGPSDFGGVRWRMPAVIARVRQSRGCLRAVALEVLLVLLLLDHHGATVLPARAKRAPPRENYARGGPLARASLAGPAGPRRSHRALDAPLWRLRGGTGDDDASAGDAVAGVDTTDHGAREAGETDERGTPASPLVQGKRPGAEQVSGMGTNATSSSEDGAVFGMQKGAIGASGGGWAMDALRRVCWYFLDILVVEAQRLRFVGHLLAAAGIVHQETIPPRLKRRRGMWWGEGGGSDGTRGRQSADATEAEGEDQHGKRAVDDDAEDGAGLVDFLRRGVAGVRMGSELETFTAREMRMLNKRPGTANASVQEEEQEEEEDEEDTRRRPKVLQQWPPPAEHFARVGDCVRLIDKRLQPGARARGVRVYNDTHLAPDQSPDDAYEHLALLQRHPEPQGRRLADDGLAVERFFSPAALQSSLRQVLSKPHALPPSLPPFDEVSASRSPPFPILPPIHTSLFSMHTSLSPSDGEVCVLEPCAHAVQEIRL